jgi:hypothetical protein
MMIWKSVFEICVWSNNSLKNSGRAYDYFTDTTSSLAGLLWRSGNADTSEFRSGNMPQDRKLTDDIKQTMLQLVQRLP